ncbi:MAG TPA: hypothetical protein VIF57_19010 [Polyangia bacterium]
MRIRWAGLLRLSALVATGGALSFAVFFSNCGGSGGTRGTGTAGTTGAGGSGTAGSGGTGGGGTAGATGTGGTGGKFMCTSSTSLACGASALKLTDGHVLTFSADEWTPMTGNYCNASGIHGSKFPYSKPASGDAAATASATADVDANAGNLKLTLTVGPGDYAGGGLAFDRCIDASAFNALRFTAYIASGDLTGCPFVSQVQTFEQRPLNASPPGGCDQDAGSCYSLPSAPVTLTTSPQTFTLPFASFTPAGTNPLGGQIVALQWQLTSGDAPDDAGSPQPSCTAEIRIDDIDFVTQ